MTKDINKVKELLHLNAFIPLDGDASCEQTMMATIDDVHFSDQILKSLCTKFGKNNHDDFAFIGGEHQSVFVLHRSALSTGFGFLIYGVTKDCWAKEVKYDLRLFKKFIISYCEKVSRE